MQVINPIFHPKLHVHNYTLLTWETVLKTKGCHHSMPRNLQVPQVSSDWMSPRKCGQTCRMMSCGPDSPPSCPW